MMNDLTRRRFLSHSLTISAATMVPGHLARASQTIVDGQATGVVFHDTVGQGVRKANCPGVPNVRVSNGVDIVTTDAAGRYTIPVAEGQTLFVIKPAGWAVPVNENQLPQFYYIHKPDGSPKWRPENPISPDELNEKHYHAGVAPTGPLPASVDFPITPQEEPTAFRFTALADTQISGHYQLHWMGKQTIREVAALKDIPFGMILGDVVNVGRVNLYEPLNQVMAGTGFPWYMAAGNHDQNLMCPDNSLATETFRSHYGPTDYAFDYGHITVLVLNNIIREPYDSQSRIREDGTFHPGNSAYHKGLEDHQWAFVENFLKTVPRDRPLVIGMHIPLGLPDPEQETHPFDRRLMNLISGRPCTLSMSGHTHRNRNYFLGKDQGFTGPGEHHHLNTAVVRGCGYRGPFDELHVPANLCMDGTPAGYSIINFDGPSYTVDYKASRRGADEQMRIYLPDEVERAQLADTPVTVNVFSSSTQSTVKMRVGNGPWQSMINRTGEDPAIAKFWEVQDENEGRRLEWWRRIPRERPYPCDNLWHASLPTPLPEGMHQLTIQHTDMFGRNIEDCRFFRVK